YFLRHRHTVSPTSRVLRTGLSPLHPCHPATAGDSFSPHGERFPPGSFQTGSALGNHPFQVRAPQRLGDAAGEDLHAVGAAVAALMHGPEQGSQGNLALTHDQTILERARGPPFADLDHEDPITARSNAL